MLSNIALQHTVPSLSDGSHYDVLEGIFVSRDHIMHCYWWIRLLSHFVMLAVKAEHTINSLQNHMTDWPDGKRRCPICEQCLPDNFVMLTHFHVVSRKSQTRQSTQLF